MWRSSAIGAVLLSLLIGTPTCGAHAATLDEILRSGQIRVGVNPTLPTSSWVR